MDKIIKIQSNQGSGFDAVKRLCDFDIPSGNVYDLSSSYVNLVASVDTAQDSTMVVNLKSTFDGKENLYPNVAFIKNAHLSSANGGQICNVRKVDTLQSTLHQYRNTFQNLSQDEYANPTNTISKKFTRNSIFRELHREGSNESVKKEARIMIPLKDIFDYCDFPEFDSNRHGTTRLGLELQVDKYVAVSSSDDNHASKNNRNVFQDITIPGAPAPPVDTNTELTTKTFVFRDEEISPYYVGQMITITSASAGNPNIVVDRKITAIDYIRDGGASNRKIKLTLDQNILGSTPASGAVAGATYTNTITLKDLVGAVSTTFSSAELVLRVVGSPQGLDSRPRPYQTYISEEYQANGAQPNHQKQINIEPNTTGVYIMYPNEVISQNVDLTNASSVRLRHNDIDLTNRDITFDTPLHRDRLIMTLSNSGYAVKSLVERVPDTREDESQQHSYQNTDAGHTIQTRLVATPLKPMNDFSLLQINHEGIQNAGGALKRVIAYKEVQKVV